MENILFIHDNSPRSRKVMAYATSLAALLNGQLIIGLSELRHHAKKPKVLAGNHNVLPEKSVSYRMSDDQQSRLSTLDISTLNGRELAQFINTQDIRLVIKCASNGTTPTLLSVETLLNHIHCPLMLIPDNWLIKDLDRMVYLADLRYCRHDVNRYLARLARACGAELSVAHLTKEGMVHIEETYAHRLFDEQVRVPLKYEKLCFHYTRERDVIKAIDVLVKGLQNDMLVMTRRRYHYNQLLRQSLDHRLPLHIQVPLLIFPG